MPAATSSATCSATARGALCVELARLDQGRSSAHTCVCTVTSAAKRSIRLANSSPWNVARGHDAHVPRPRALRGRLDRGLHAHERHAGILAAQPVEETAAEAVLQSDHDGAALLVSRKPRDPIREPADLVERALAVERVEALVRHVDQRDLRQLGQQLPDGQARRHLNRRPLPAPWWLRPIHEGYGAPTAPFLHAAANPSKMRRDGASVLHSIPSGCHWTPSVKRRAGCSMASTEPSLHARWPRTVRHPFQPLVMEAVGPYLPLAQQSARAGRSARPSPGASGGPRHQLRPAVVVAHRVGQLGDVLPENCSHVEQLDAAADGQQRQVVPQRPAGKDGSVSSRNRSTAPRCGCGASPYAAGSTSTPPAKHSPPSRL